MTAQQVRLHAGSIPATFGVAIALLASAHLATQLVKFHLGLPDLYGLVRQFNVGVEANLPTFFSSLQLLVASALLAAIGLVRQQARDCFARHWLFLALIFFLLAADEMGEVHEMAIRPVRELAPSVATGIFHWGWVIPAAILVLIVSLSYARFVFRYLPPATRNSTLLGAMLFVGGAIGVEMPEARHVERHGMENFTYGAFVLVEEVLEMTGVLVFLTGLLRHFRRYGGTVTLEMASACEREGVGAGPLTR